MGAVQGIFIFTSCGDGRSSIESSARNLVSLLMNTLAASSSSGQPESRTVQQEMTRFPGFWLKHFQKWKAFVEDGCYTKL
ncbi:hypothetical protein AMECASPLE_031681 [Ameca splendens]|uniref:Uncharacterized protein n=1 Tax=Ameca splendens TaxID=208324 RepID=A0ABV1ADL6_9TELE